MDDQADDAPLRGSVRAELSDVEFDDEGGAGSEAEPEIDVPEPPVTGDDIVDQASATLARAMDEPLELQVQAFERAHRTLQDRLADVER